MMKKYFLLALGLLATLAMPAQKQQEKVFEEAQARVIEPEVKVFVRPQIAEMQILEGQHRQYYGPYTFAIKGAEDITVGQFENFKNRALFRAMKEADADIIVGALFDAYVTENAQKQLVIELSGFPAKYVNFKSLGADDTSDYEMIRVVYPTVNKVVEQQMKTQATK